MVTRGDSYKHGKPTSVVPKNNTQPGRLMRIMIASSLGDVTFTRFPRHWREPAELSLVPRRHSFVKIRPNRDPQTRQCVRGNQSRIVYRTFACPHPRAIKS